jgi:hypothetical protein
MELRAKLLFTKNPHEADLSDTVFASRRLDEDTIDYHSNDAECDNFEVVSNNICRVFWKPKNGRVEPGEPYEHHNCFEIPGEKDFWHKSLTIAAPVFCARFQLALKSEQAVRRVIVYRAGRFQNFKNHEQIARRATRLKKTNAPLPKKHSGNDTHG